MSKLSVVVIHGQGSDQPDFADDFTEEIRDRLTAAGLSPGDVAWRPVHWADLIGPREDQYFSDMVDQTDVDYRSLRRFLITSFGDAAAYQRSGAGPTGVYDAIHTRVKAAVTELESEVEPDSPIVFIGYSLGAQIASNYVWDTQKTLPSGTTPFEQLHSLVGFVTFGSTIPLFTFAHNPVKTITLPATQLPTDVKEKSRWINFYDDGDVLCYPLEPLGGEYAALAEDFPIRVGVRLSGWNPLSHRDYWTDNDITKPVAEFLEDLLVP
jgi:predicted esterase